MHVKVIFYSATVRATPVQRHIFPTSAGRNSIVGPAFGFVIDQAANATQIFLVFQTFHRIGRHECLSVPLRFIIVTIVAFTDSACRNKVSQTHATT